MKKTASKYRILFTGGGTGGHLFPAVAVAQKVRELQPDADILFVGTGNKIEANVVPKLGYKFRSIWISGFRRSLSLQNLLFPVKLLVSMLQSLAISMSFKPKVAIGSGAYVTGPALWGASIMGAKIMLLEQNSYPGITNRMLEKKADEIHLSFEDSKKYFRDESKLYLSGNPVRVDFGNMSREESAAEFGFDANKKILLILGGSLGAGSINNTVADKLDEITQSGQVQVLWQTGKNYYEQYKIIAGEGVKINPFIENMNAAYSCADLVIARAGATTIAETALLGLPVVFVPSPNVAEDHQYKNAKSIEDAGGCVLIKDSALQESLLPVVSELLNNSNERAKLSSNIKKFSKPEAADVIAGRVLALADQNF